MNVTLLTHYLPNWQALGDLVVPQRNRYCARHGYMHVVQVGPYRHPEYEEQLYAVDRLHLVHDLLLRPGGPDLLWVLNVAGVIMDEARPVTDFVPADDVRAVFMARHCGGYLNAASWLIRRTPVALAWLRMVIAEVERTWPDGHENQVMHETWPAWQTIVAIVPQPCFNSLRHDWYPDMRLPLEDAGHYCPGHFLLYVGGLPYETRLAHVQELLDDGH